MMQMFGPPSFFPEWLNNSIFFMSFVITGVALLFLAVPSWFTKAEKWITREVRQEELKERGSTASDHEVIERQKQIDERRERLWRQWEADRRDGRKAARLMMVVSRDEAEEIYQDFRPFDEEDPQRIYHISKCYQWAVGYAWACRLALADEFAGVGEILQETDLCAGFWDKSDRQRDSEEDKQKFFIEPGGQEAFNRWKAEQET